MKKVLKIFLEVIFIFLGIALILVFLAFSAKSEIVPDIKVTSESGRVAMAVRGNYKWNSFTESVEINSLLPQNYIYASNNVLLVTPGEKMTFRNSDNPLSSYKFYQQDMKYYDTSGVETVLPSLENSKAYADLKYLEINAPDIEGTYVYEFTLSYYNKGTVSYGLKVVVSSEPSYEIKDLIRYKNTSLKDLASIQDILELLPYSQYKTGVVVRTNLEASEIIINYSQLAVDQSALSNNTIALFTLIPELNFITYCTETEEITYTRSEIEKQVGRNLSDYANNIELWESEILFKEEWKDEKVTRDEIYKMILSDIISENFSTGEDVIMVDTSSMSQNDIIPISTVDQYEILEYLSTDIPNVYDMSLEEYQNIHAQGLFIYVLSVDVVNESEESGDSLQSESEEVTQENQNTMEDDNNETLLANSEEEQNLGEEIAKESKVICKVGIIKNGAQKEKEYEIYYADEKWNAIEL